MGCRPAWIIHEQRGRVAVGCCRVKGRVGVGVGGVSVWGGGWRWLPVVSVIRDGPTNLPPGMWQISKRRGGGWIAAGTSVSIPDLLFYFWEAI